MAYGLGGLAGTTVVLLRAPGRVASYTAVPFGQSDNPDSPHARDQAEALFSQERLKSTGYRQAGAPLPATLRLQHTLTMP